MPTKAYLDALDVAGLLALRAGGHVKADAFAFGQGLETVALNCGKVCEQIVATVIRRNETKTLGLVEPLDDTRSHLLNLQKYMQKGITPNRKGRDRGGDD